MSDRIRLGTRGSALALAQTEWVAAQLQRFYPDLRMETRLVRTRGDQIRDVALSQVGGKGLFTREIEELLLAGEVDLAVHSLKDLPTVLPDGLCLGAVPARVRAQDALVLRSSPAAEASSLPSPGLRLPLLPPGARVGTSSLRRRAQLLHLRPDLKITDLRGNLDTRLRKLDAGDFDALVLAAAGLDRMGWGDRISYELPFDVFLPAVGQGALGIEIRAEDESFRTLVGVLEDFPTRAAVTAERSFLQALEGGCQVPIAAVGTREGNRLRLRGLVASVEGQDLIRDEVWGEMSQAEALGVELAQRLLAGGAARILAEVRERSHS